MQGIIDFNFLILQEDTIVEVHAEQTTDLNRGAEPQTEVRNIYMITSNQKVINSLCKSGDTGVVLMIRID